MSGSIMAASARASEELVLGPFSCVLQFSSCFCLKISGLSAHLVTVGSNGS